MAEIIKPSGYGIIPPPKKQASYIDSGLVTPIKRMTDSPKEGYSSATIEYSSACPWNCNNAAFLAQIGGGSISLYGRAGTLITKILGVVHSSEPRWSKKDPNLFYYVSNNQLIKYSVNAAKSTWLATFGYVNVYGGGESDLSEDGDHLVLSGGLTQEHGENRSIFVYEISTNQISSVMLWPTAFNNLYITPDNNVLVSAENGVFMLVHSKGAINNWSWNIKKVAQTQAHQDVTRNAQGDEVLVRTNSADPQPLAGCDNGVEVVRLADGDRQCILPLGWSKRGGEFSLACHISCSDNGKVLVSTYAPSNPTVDQWEPYTNELILVDLNGYRISRLAHHRSVKLDDYQYEPKASISRDGREILFNSNWGLQPTPNYADIYSISIPQVVTLPQTTLAGWHKITYKPGVEYRMVINADGTLNIWEKD